MKRKEALGLLDELKVMFRFEDSTDYFILRNEEDSSDYRLVIKWIPKRREELVLRKLVTQYDLHIEVCKDKTTFQKKSEKTDKKISKRRQQETQTMLSRKEMLKGIWKP